ncbi:MAG: D-aminoacyl-tRNA deacylase [Bacillota bacterium]
MEEVRRLGIEVETGRFQTVMTVSVDNDGPVTILLDSKKQF